MDKYSFLNSANTAYFAELYDQYLKSPDTVEPSWRAFFQGFDFGQENGTSQIEVNNLVPENIKKEFQVVKLIDAYRNRGHLFTKTNPVRARRSYSPNLDFQNFGLEEKDLKTVFSAGEIMGIGSSTLAEIINHLQQIYCDSIGIEYMYIRNPVKVNWIQKKLNVNTNHPKFTSDQKKHILSKLNEAVSFENFLHTKFVGQKRFSLEGGESLIPAIDSIIELAADKGVEELVNYILKQLPEGPQYYPDEMITDNPEAFWVAELVREQLLAIVKEELPHSIATRVTEWEWPRIRCEILVERESQKGIVIGKKGLVLKEVGTKARQHLPEEVFLELFVRVDKNWQRQPRALNRLGY